MQTKAFHSIMSSMLSNLSVIQSNFEENKSFERDSVLAKTLASLSVQVDNLSLFLVDGFVNDYQKKYDHAQK